MQHELERLAALYVWETGTRKSQSFAQVWQRYLNTDRASWIDERRSIEVDTRETPPSVGRD